MLGSILTILFLISLVILLKIIGERIGTWLEELDFELDEPIPLDKVEYGDRDENGFCEIIVNGSPTGRKILIFTEEQAKKIEEVKKRIGDDKAGGNTE